MHIKLATALALAPFLVQATPTHPASGTKIALSKRSSPLVKNGVVDIVALQSHISHVQGKIARGFANYEKNTGKVHPNYKNATVQHKRSTGTESLTDENNLLWQGTISVGTPPVKYTVDFDTGSSDLFLPGANCDSSCSGHTLYDPSKSSTAQDFDETFDLSYGDGSTVSGEQFTDTVTLVGLTATNQRLGAATSYSGFEASRFPSDGLLGLAFESISGYNSPPVFQSLVSQSQTNSGEFGFTLLTSGSELFLGGVDTTKFSGSLTYTDVIEEGFWGIELEGVSVNSQTVSGSQAAIVDTGTTLVIGDTLTVERIYAGIPGAVDASSTLGPGLFTYPCDTATNDIALTLGGKQFTISSETLNTGAIAPGSSNCVGGIVASDDQDFWILGDVFLRNVYTSFDVDNLRVGFATVN